MKDTFSTYHPLLNMLYFVGVIGVTVFVVHPVILAISLFGGIAYSVLLKGWKKTVKFNLIFSIPMMLIVALMNPMFNHYGVTIIGYLHNGNPFTLESCVYGLVMAMMLVCTMIWFSCYTIVMTSDKFIYLFGKVTPRLSLVLSMALRFIPLFRRQIGAISKTQKAMGLYSTESRTDRVLGGMRLFDSLLSWSIENSLDTADAMKARGYGLPGRVNFSMFQFRKRDGVLLGVILLLGIFIMAGFFCGQFDFYFYPVMDEIPKTVRAVCLYGCVLVFMTLPTLLEIKEKLQWNYLKSKI